MVRIIKTLFGRLLLLSVCSVGMIIALALEFGRGLLSPRELGIALLILCVAIGSGALLMIRKSASEYGVAHGGPIEKDSREQRLRDIRRLKITVVVLVLLLLNGLRYIGDAPLLPLTVGIGLNLLTTVTIIRRINRLQNSLNQT